MKYPVSGKETTRFLKIHNPGRNAVGEQERIIIEMKFKSEYPGLDRTYWGLGH